MIHFIVIDQKTFLKLRLAFKIERKVSCHNSFQSFNTKKVLLKLNAQQN